MATHARLITAPSLDGLGLQTPPLISRQGRRAPKIPNLSQPHTRTPSREFTEMLQASGEDLRLLRLELLLGEHPGILQLTELLQVLEHVVG